VNHEWQRLRDVPRSCLCIWLWIPDKAGYARVQTTPGCPRHTRGAVMAYATEDPPVLGPVNVQVARPAYDRLTVLQGRLRGEKGRPVSYSEAVEWLLDHQREEVAR